MNTGIGIIDGVGLLLGLSVGSHARNRDWGRQRSPARAGEVTSSSILRELSKAARSPTRWWISETRCSCRMFPS